MKILIVGAGPTGLTTGVELARHNISVKVIDRKSAGSTLSRAVGISPRSLKLLQPSGAPGELIRQGIRAETLTIYQSDKLLSSVSIQLDDQPDQFFVALAQDRTESVLREIFLERGGLISYGTKLMSLTQDNNIVSVTYEDHTTEEFDYVVGADGVRSTTR